MLCFSQLKFVTFYHFEYAYKLLNLVKAPDELKTSKRTWLSLVKFCVTVMSDEGTTIQVLLETVCSRLLMMYYCRAESGT